MKINKSSTEGAIHFGLKLKVIEKLEKRNDIIEIKTEHEIKKEDKYYYFVDVFARKKDGGDIYVEVKSDNTLPQAIGQLFVLDKGNINDEFMAICNFERPYFLKKLWRDRLLDWQEFVNRTKIYSYDEELLLKYRDIRFTNGEELWIDGNRIV